MTFLSNQSGRLLSRPTFIELLEAGLVTGAIRFTRQAALSWLGTFPGDLAVSRLYAETLFQSGAIQRALPVLENICLVDPEDRRAQEMLAVARQVAGMAAAAVARGCAYALGSPLDHAAPLPPWAEDLRRARLSLAGGDLEEASRYSHQALLAGQEVPLVAVTHLIVSSRRSMPVEAMRDLAGYYHQRWPACVSFTLILAGSLLEGGEPEMAVELLHQAAAQDVSGQAAERLWGPEHSFRSLWPEQLDIRLAFAIPAEVAAHLGWNRLAPGEQPVQEHAGETSLPVEMEDTQPLVLAKEPDPGTKPTPAGDPQVPPSSPERRPAPAFSLPEVLQPVQAELERLAARLKRAHLAGADGRFPIYVVFTTRQGLEKQYGEQAPLVETAIRRLVTAVRKRPDWGALVLYADDPESAGPFGLQPAQPGDPWSLKLALADLDLALARRGEMIGAVLILGGPEVVPFHHLPNPVDDADVDVPSDNPYSTRSENYFVPEWLVGRLPGGAGGDAEILANTLRRMAASHQERAVRLAWYRRLWRRAMAGLARRARRVRPSWGYTAAVWLRASLSVFHPIGDSQSLVVSPPVQADGKRRRKLLPNTRLSYFNLHGLPDASEWYGQRDPTKSSADPDYPVALRIQDVVNGGRAPEVVFSEACFGAHVLGKGVEEALSLKFLASGTHVVVGSTCTSYGSITPPLIGADLLGHAFWKYLREGLVAGEALRRAKIRVVREMVRRQGYLDGEDQKTLISFVLYGDPLAAATDGGPGARSVYRPLKNAADVKTVCDRSDPNRECQEPEGQPAIPQETLVTVRRLVEQYLPGMAGAQLSYSQAKVTLEADGQSAPGSKTNKKSRPAKPVERRVVTLSKQVEKKDAEGQAVRIHCHYAHLTLDKKGKVVKMAVSR